MPESIVDAVVALDDDPTGAQTLANVHVLLAWSPERVATALADRQAIHLMTNARALAPEAAREVVRSAARAAAIGAPEAHILLRGDSTLRGHVREELIALRDAVDPNGLAPVLLVPALPAAGRVTVGGIHMLERGGMRTPLDQTEYAHDGLFSYTSSRLLEWAEDRTGGLLPAKSGQELHLDDLRSGGADAVAAVIAALDERACPAAFAPDAENDHDLRLIAEGYALAHASGTRALVRCAPAFVGVLSGTTAEASVEPPRCGGAVLVVCGSYVPTTTRQLRRLLDDHPGSLVEVDVKALASDRTSSEVERAAAEAAQLLAGERLAVVSTPRERPPGTTSLEMGNRIARGLAAIVAALDPLPRTIVAKGGITSHLILELGLAVDEAEVIGPLVPGVSRWRVRTRGTPIDYVVFPGNVGDNDLLLTLVRLVME